jgi:hypothetical protein
VELAEDRAGWARLELWGRQRGVVHRGGVDERRGADAELTKAESGVDPAGAELSVVGWPFWWTQR